MERKIGTVAMGIRAPLIKEGDNIIDVVVDSVIGAQGENSFKLKDKDVIGITESLVARAQGNYVTVDQVADEIYYKFSGEVGVVFPILSRNRFSLILKAISRGSERVNMLLKYPNDEVGNPVMDKEVLYTLGINPFSEILEEKDYIKHFSGFKHPNTGINYVDFYRDIVKSEGAEFSVLFSNITCCLSILSIILLNISDENDSILFISSLLSFICSLVSIASTVLSNVSIASSFDKA